MLLVLLQFDLELLDLEVLALDLVHQKADPLHQHHDLLHFQLVLVLEFLPLLLLSEHLLLQVLDLPLHVPDQLSQLLQLQPMVLLTLHNHHLQRPHLLLQRCNLMVLILHSVFQLRYLVGQLDDILLCAVVLLCQLRNLPFQVANQLLLDPKILGVVLDIFQVMMVLVLKLVVESLDFPLLVLQQLHDVTLILFCRLIADFLHIPLLL